MSTASPVARAFQILGQLWIAEVDAEGINLARALPELSDSFEGTDEASLTELAVSYQRLFGFNLPPYESVFIDPSAMLSAPSTARFGALLADAGWSMPRGARVAAVDHLGVQLLACGDLLADPARAELGRQILEEHLALWLPAFVESLGQLAPPPFYHVLAALSLGLVLGQLLEAPDMPEGREDPFPELPPAPRYVGQEQEATAETQPKRTIASNGKPLPSPSESGDSDADQPRPRLLVARDCGAFLSLRDLGEAAIHASLPRTGGDRRRAWRALRDSAQTYDRQAALKEALASRLAEADASYAAWMEAWPAWRPYGQAWRSRLDRSRAALERMIEPARTMAEPRPPEAT